MMLKYSCWGKGRVADTHPGLKQFCAAKFPMQDNKNQNLHRQQTDREKQIHRMDIKGGKGRLGA